MVAVIECLQGRADAGAGGGQKLLALSVMIPLTQRVFFRRTKIVYTRMSLKSELWKAGLGLS